MLLNVMFNVIMLKVGMVSVVVSVIMLQNVRLSVITRKVIMISIVVLSVIKLHNCMLNV